LLDIHVPNTYIPERRYIIQTLMQDFLGIDIQILIEERKDVLIDDNSKKGRTLCVADIFFKTLEDHWLTQDSLTKQSLSVWDTTNIIYDVALVFSKLPVIYGCEVEKTSLTKSYLMENQDEVYLGLDIFGSAFFMLTRYEELVKPDRDRHDRFPATASLAYQEGFLDRPIINEYVEILWWCMKKLWPRLERKKRNFQMRVSHDVDAPFALADIKPLQFIRSCGGDIIKRRNPALAWRRFLSWQAVKQGDYTKDINYTFDRIMDVNEKYNIKSAFYFKTGCTNPVYDNGYSFEHENIRQLLRTIHKRGHEIGLHPSYETYQNPEQTKAEFHKLLQVCEEEGIQQDQWGGRQHYLRWQVPVTWRNWAEAGLNYDSTLSYADHAGFRCGVCYEYSVYDLEQRKKLPLIERPLIVMEGTVLEDKYMGLKGLAAFDRMNKLKEISRKFNGDFTLLWHNSSFLEKWQWEIYQSVVN